MTRHDLLFVMSLHDQVDRIGRLAGRLGGWLFAILPLILGAYLGWKFFRRWRFLRELRIARITPEELRARLEAGEDIEIVDVRHSLDFQAEPFTIPGATYIAAEQFEEGSSQNMAPTNFW